MSKIVSVHSFRGGTGKSNATANVAAQLAINGLRVGVVDTDIASPGIHVLFKLNEDEMTYALNDYLWGNCEIGETAYEVTSKFEREVPGSVYLVPSSIKPGEIAKVLRQGYDVGLLNDGFQDLLDVLKLDVLLIDTHPGLNEETLLSIAVSDVLLIILRPDLQDYQGTGVTVEVARRLGVPDLYMVVNKVPQAFEMAEIQERVQNAYQVDVAAMLPHSEEMMILASDGIFSLNHPDHPLADGYRQLAGLLRP